MGFFSSMPTAMRSPRAGLTSWVGKIPKATVFFLPKEGISYIPDGQLSCVINVLDAGHWRYSHAAFASTQIRNKDPSCLFP